MCILPILLLCLGQHVAIRLHLSTPNKQVEFIAAIFGLDASAPLWLVKQSGNVAVAARGGKFAGSLIVSGATYDVRGREKQENLSPAVPSRARKQAPGVVSPFGAYRMPTYTTPQFAPVSSVGKAQK